MGDPQWHAGVDPASVETYCGGFINYWIWKNLLCGAVMVAVYSVACLEWILRDKGTLIRCMAMHGSRDGLLKSYLQKRLEALRAAEENS